jgi:uncharacterized membrane protein
MCRMLPDGLQWELLSWMITFAIVFGGGTVVLMALHALTAGRQFALVLLAAHFAMPWLVAAAWERDYGLVYAAITWPLTIASLALILLRSRGQTNAPLAGPPDAEFRWDLRGRSRQ